MENALHHLFHSLISAPSLPPLSLSDMAPLAMLFGNQALGVFPKSSIVQLPPLNALKGSILFLLVVLGSLSLVSCDADAQWCLVRRLSLSRGYSWVP